MDFYRIHDFTLKPKPLNTVERPNPELFQGGNSSAAQENAGRYSDWYFSNGKDYDGVTEQLDNIRRVARDHDREVKLGLNAFIIARDTEKEARDTLREIIDKANKPAVEGFKGAVQQAGSSSKDGKGMWADSSFEDLVQLQRRVQEQAHRNPRTGRASNSRVSQPRRRFDPGRIPALPRGDRVLRRQDPASGAGDRGGVETVQGRLTKRLGRWVGSVG